MAWRNTAATLYVFTLNNQCKPQSALWFGCSFKYFLEKYFSIVWSQQPDQWDDRRGGGWLWCGVMWCDGADRLSSCNPLGEPANNTNISRAETERQRDILHRPHHGQQYYLLQTPETMTSTQWPPLTVIKVLWSKNGDVNAVRFHLKDSCSHTTQPIQS